MFKFHFLTFTLLLGFSLATTKPPTTQNFPTDVTGKPLEISTTPLMTTEEGDPIEDLTHGSWHPEPTDYESSTQTTVQQVPTSWVPTTTYSPDDGLVHCHLNDTEFIDTQERMNQLTDCQVIDGSLFITGHEITNLKGLSNVKRITGSLVVVYLTRVNDLVGFKNLTLIEGREEELYLDDYAVFIAHNHPIGDSSTGLCYADKVNWTQFVSNGQIHVDDNRQECPECHSQCQGCYGMGSQNCQSCSNFLSGITCVEECFPESDSQVEDGLCQETLPGTPLPPFVSILNSTAVSVSLNLGNSNGVPLKVELWRNQTLVYTWLWDWNSEEELELPYQFLDGGLEPMTYYQYYWKVVNSIGESPFSNAIIVETMESSEPPASPSNLTVSKIDTRSADLSWYQSKSNQSRISGFRLVLWKLVVGDTYQVVFNRTLDKDANQYHLDELMGQGFYRLTLWSFTSQALSRFPATVEFQTPSHLPCAPSLDVFPEDKLILEWDSDKCLWVGHILDYQLLIGNFEFNFTGNATGFEYDWFHFNQGELLNIMIRSRTTAGWSNWTHSSVIVPEDSKEGNDGGLATWIYVVIFASIIIFLIVMVVLICGCINRRSRSRRAVGTTVKHNNTVRPFINPLYQPGATEEDDDAGHMVSQFHRTHAPVNTAREEIPMKTIYDHLDRTRQTRSHHSLPHAIYDDNGSGVYGFPLK